LFGAPVGFKLCAGRANERVQLCQFKAAGGQLKNWVEFTQLMEWNHPPSLLPPHAQTKGPSAGNWPKGAPVSIDDCAAAKESEASSRFFT